jgi:hypothetical protein
VSGFSGPKAASRGDEVRQGAQGRDDQTRLDRPTPLGSCSVDDVDQLPQSAGEVPSIVEAAREGEVPLPGLLEVDAIDQRAQEGEVVAPEFANAGGQQSRLGASWAAAAARQGRSRAVGACLSPFSL